jgi:hypothetical protein
VTGTFWRLVVAHYDVDHERAFAAERLVTDTDIESNILGLKGTLTLQLGNAIDEVVKTQAAVEAGKPEELIEVEA